jgi:ribosomal protein S18 acetylase RimI-like enzyme
MRAVVRRRIEQGGHGGKGAHGAQGVHSVTDALGEVVAIDATTVSVQTRLALVVIERSLVVAAKEVPPRATRRGAPHLAISMDDLERAMVAGWPPVELAELGDWLLRAAGGFTGRGNSVLPLGSPGVPLSEAIDTCERWYDDRGLRRLFALFGPAGFEVDNDPLGRELAQRSYQPFNHTVVLTAATRALPGEAVRSASSPLVRLEPEPSPQWWDAWAGREGHSEPASSRPDAASTVMTGSPEQLFASLEVGGVVAGLARVAFAHRWAGVFALHVLPDHRRAGVAMQLMGALADATRARGIPSMYLQVLKDSSPARALYEGLGFSVHHEYRYLGA